MGLSIRCGDCHVAPLLATTMRDKRVVFTANHTGNATFTVILSGSAAKDLKPPDCHVASLLVMTMRDKRVLFTANHIGNAIQSRNMLSQPELPQTPSTLATITTVILSRNATFTVILSSSAAKDLNPPDCHVASLLAMTMYRDALRNTNPEHLYSLYSRATSLTEFLSDLPHTYLSHSILQLTPSF